MSIFPRILLLSGLLGVSSVQAFAAGVTSDDLKKAATALGQEYDSNYASKNAEGMASLYEKDGLLVSPAGPGVRGRDALVDYYKKRFASGASGHHIDIREVHVQGNGGYSVASFSVSVPSADGKARRESGSIVSIYQHDASGWHLRLVEPSVPETASK